MNKVIYLIQVTNTTLILSDLYRKNLDDFLQDVDTLTIQFLGFIKQCEKMQDNFLEIDSLAKKM